MSGSHVKYVLIGGGVASSAAIQAIRQRDPDGTILLVGQEVNRPYHRPPLSKDYLLGRKSAAQLFTLPDKWFIDNRVELRTGRRATSLDTPRQTVTLDDGDELGFDQLLIATGGTPKHLQTPGAALPNLYYLRSVVDADRLHNAIEKARREGLRHEHGRGRVGVIGGGLLGVELAATFTELGLAVDLLVAKAHPWSRFAGEALGRFAARHFEQRGVRIHLQTVPNRLEGDGRVQRIVTSSGQVLPVDFVVPALGTSPNRDLLRGTAIEGERAILVDEYCRTSHPGIYAAGDCAAIFDSLFGKHRLLDHWESARTTGELAGRNMAGANDRYASVASFYTEPFGLPVRVWGEARQVERRIIRGNATLESPDFLEIGIAADGRIAQVVAVNHRGEDDLLRDLVRRRLNISTQEQALRDPSTRLADLLA